MEMTNKDTLPFRDIEHVLECYADMVYRLALLRTGNKSDGEDVFQEVFERLVKKYPDFQSEAHIKAWLIRVTLNCTKKLFASAWFRKISPLEKDYAIENEVYEDVYEAIFSLPVKYRTVIHLHYFEGYSCKEIAEMLKSKEATVKTQLSRGRNLLKVKLEGRLDENEEHIQKRCI